MTRTGLQKIYAYIIYLVYS